MRAGRWPSGMSEVYNGLRFVFAQCNAQARALLARFRISCECPLNEVRHFTGGHGGMPDVTLSKVERVGLSYRWLALGLQSPLGVQAAGRGNCLKYNLLGCTDREFVVDVCHGRGRVCPVPCSDRDGGLSSATLRASCCYT